MRKWNAREKKSVTPMNVSKRWPGRIGRSVKTACPASSSAELEDDLIQSCHPHGQGTHLVKYCEILAQIYFLSRCNWIQEEEIKRKKGKGLPFRGRYYSGLFDISKWKNGLLLVSEKTANE